MPVDPAAARIQLPAVYGLPADSRLLDWEYVESKLVAARHYWVATADDRGVPHPRPVDGIWMDHRLYFGGHPDSKWRRNLRTNPTMAVHLEDAEHVVVAQGESTMTRPDHVLAGRLAAASDLKYGTGQALEHYEDREIGVFAPRVVLAWDVLYVDATRFTFDT